MSFNKFQKDCKFHIKPAGIRCVCDHPENEGETCNTYNCPLYNKKEGIAPH